MTNNNTGTHEDESGLGRRDFILMASTAAAGVFGGASLAWGLGRAADAQAQQALADDLALQLDASGASAADLNALLQAAHTEIETLNGQLTSQAGELATARSEASETAARLAEAQAQIETLTAEVQRLGDELARTQDDNGILSGLIELYEGLDEIDLDGIVEAGLLSLAVVWSRMRGAMTVLSSGITLAAGLLDNFEITLANLRASINRVIPLNSSLTTQLEAVRSAAADAAAAALDPISEFVIYVLDNLPFGIGENARDTLILMRNTLNAAPNTVSETETRVLTPMQGHVALDTKGWKATVVTPIRDDVLTKGSDLLDKIDEADVVLKDDVVTPSNSAIAERKLVRQQIASYKRDHGIA